MPLKKLPFLLGLCLISTYSMSAPVAQASPDQEQWIELFNGQDLNDWGIKIKGSALGENTYNTFRVENGLLKARYDQYPEFTDEFGHIFYTSQPFSYYRIVVEYRFIGDQVSGGPAWAYRNNGIMYHTQSASSMQQDQDFPLSMEYQLLGGNGTDERSTGNLCTPGTHVVIDGELRTDHCITSSSPTYHGDQWVTAELEVHGSELAIHTINGQEVMRYEELQKDDGTPLTGGYIALQAESGPADFRRVSLLNLEGCMDKKAGNFKSYLVKNNPKTCLYK